MPLFMLLHKPEVRGEEARAPAQEDGYGVCPGSFLANPRRRQTIHSGKEKEDEVDFEAAEPPASWSWLPEFVYNDKWNNNCVEPVLKRKTLRLAGA